MGQLKCAVGGMIQRGAMCGSVIVGGKLCGHNGTCKHQRHEVEDPYWEAKCRACGWRGSSQDCNGELAIADTGDHSELRCPNCDSVLIDEADTETPNAL